MTSLGGLFAVDIVSRRAAGAVMGFVGVFSYLAAAVQENVSGLLIERGVRVIDGVRHYDFSGAITFWLACSAFRPSSRHALARARAKLTRKLFMPDNQRFDLITIGNYTKDTIVTRSGTRHVHGGGFNYAARAARGRP
ncbi:MAG TPA: hypothetical protein VF787_27960 [Thermoanaerobaculia bacterium]